MLNNIKLALNDILEDKYKILIYILFLSSTMYIFTSATHSLIINSRLKTFQTSFNNDFVEFQGFLTSYSYQESNEMFNSLSSIYNKDIITYLTEYNNDSNAIIYYIFGDNNFLPKEMQFKEDIAVFGNQAYCNNKKSIIIKGTKYSVTEIDDSKVYFNYNVNNKNTKKVYIVIQNAELIDWIQNPNTILYDLISNTRILKGNPELINKFLKLSNKSYLTVKQVNVENNNDTMFVPYYLYPMLGSTIFASLILIHIILEGTINKKKKEFIIHLIHGANKTHLYMRYTIYLLVIILLSYLLITRVMSLNKIRYIILTISHFIIFVIMFISFASIITKTNLSINLRGDESWN